MPDRLMSIVLPVYNEAANLFAGKFLTYAFKTLRIIKYAPRDG